MTRRLLVIVVLAFAGASARGEAVAQTVSEGVVVLPLRSRGLSPAEHRRVASRMAAAFKEARVDVVAPEDLLSRISRDERRRASLEEARRLVADGSEKSLNLESAAAIASFDRALAIYRDSFGELVDPIAVADAHLKRAAEKLETDPAGARADLAAAVMFAPDRVPSIDDFPPKLVEAYDAVRSDRTRDPYRPEEARIFTAFGAALGIAQVAVVAATRTEDGVTVDLMLFSTRRPTYPPRLGRALLPTLADAMEPLGSSVVSLVGRSSVAIGPGDDVPRPDPVRRPPPVRRRNDTPLWKNKWVWAGGGALAVLGIGFGVYSSQQQEKDEGPGFKVILVPAPPEDS